MHPAQRGLQEPPSFKAPIPKLVPHLPHLPPNLHPRPPNHLPPKLRTPQIIDPYNGTNITIENQTTQASSRTEAGQYHDRKSDHPSIIPNRNWDPKHVALADRRRGVLIFQSPCGAAEAHPRIAGTRHPKLIGAMCSEERKTFWSRRGAPPNRWNTT